MYIIRRLLAYFLRWHGINAHYRTIGKIYVLSLFWPADTLTHLKTAIDLLIQPKIFACSTRVYAYTVYMELLPVRWNQQCAILKKCDAIYFSLSHQGTILVTLVEIDDFIASSKRANSNTPKIKSEVSRLPSVGWLSFSQLLSSSLGINQESTTAAYAKSEASENPCSSIGPSDENALLDTIIFFQNMDFNLDTLCIYLKAAKE